MTPEHKSQDDILEEVRRTVAEAGPERVLKLLRDILAPDGCGQDRVETLH